MKLLKITAIVLFVFILLLIPLFGTYVATVQAIPGEWTYPVKQQTEKVIDNLSKISSTSFAYFSLLKAQRRYGEVIGLINAGQDIGDADQALVAQAKQTLLDIQSVSDENQRINYYSQYQTFLDSAKENFGYQIDSLQKELKRDKKAGAKTFQTEVFSGENGRLVAKPTTLTQGELLEKKFVPDEILISNITQLEQLQASFKLLIKPQ